MRGFFEIGVYNGKTVQNLGTLYRSAYQLGACGIFTIGSRYKVSSADTCASYRHIPLRHFDTFQEYLGALPYGVEVVAVEMGGVDLPGFAHPKAASYLLGAEDKGIPDEVLGLCHRVVSIPSVRINSFNQAVAGSLVMFDRFSKVRRS